MICVQDLDGAHSGFHRLPFVFHSELLPLFTRLSNNTLLNRCVLGLTQNQNEAANQILWNKCLKTKFCGRIKLLLAVCETVCHYNTGAGSRAALLKASGVKPNLNMIGAFRKADDIRIRKAAMKISEKARLKRRKLQANKKSKTKEKVSYMAGGFGLSDKPEDVTGIPKKKRMNVAEKSVVAKDTATKKMKQDINELKGYTTNEIDFLKNSYDTLPIIFVDDNDILDIITLKS